MTKPWEMDWSQAQPATDAKPWERDWGTQPQPEPEAPAFNVGDAVRTKRGVGYLTAEGGVEGADDTGEWYDPNPVILGKVETKPQPIPAGTPVLRPAGPPSIAQVFTNNMEDVLNMSPAAAGARDANAQIYANDPTAEYEGAGAYNPRANVGAEARRRVALEGARTDSGAFAPGGGDPRVLMEDNPLTPGRDPVMVDGTMGRVLTQGAALAGGFTGAMRDPANLATLPAEAPTMVGRVLQQAGINAGMDAPTQALDIHAGVVDEMRRLQDPNLQAPPAQTLPEKLLDQYDVGQTGIAAASGAALQGAVELPGIISRARGVPAPAPEPAPQIRPVLSLPETPPESAIVDRPPEPRATEPLVTAKPDGTVEGRFYDKKEEVLARDLREGGAKTAARMELADASQQRWDAASKKAESDYDAFAAKEAEKAAQAAKDAAAADKEARYEKVTRAALALRDLGYSEEDAVRLALKPGPKPEAFQKEVGRAVDARLKEGPKNVEPVAATSDSVPPVADRSSDSRPPAAPPRAADEAPMGRAEWEARQAELGRRLAYEAPTRNTESRADVPEAPRVAADSPVRPEPAPRADNVREDPALASEGRVAPDPEFEAYKARYISHDADRNQFAPAAEQKSARESTAAFVETPEFRAQYDEYKASKAAADAAPARAEDAPGAPMTANKYAADREALSATKGGQAEFIDLSAERARRVTANAPREITYQDVIDLARAAIADIEKIGRDGVADIPGLGKPRLVDASDSLPPEQKRAALEAARKDAAEKAKAAREARAKKIVAEASSLSEALADAANVRGVTDRVRKEVAKEVKRAWAAKVSTPSLDERAKPAGADIRALDKAVKDARKALSAAQRKGLPEVDLKPLREAVKTKNAELQAARDAEGGTQLNSGISMDEAARRARMARKERLDAEARAKAAAELKANPAVTEAADIKAKMDAKAAEEKAAKDADAARELQAAKEAAGVKPQAGPDIAALEQKAKAARKDYELKSKNGFPQSAVTSAWKKYQAVRKELEAAKGKPPTTLYSSVGGVPPEEIGKVVDLAKRVLGEVDFADANRITTLRMIENHLNSADPVQVAKGAWKLAQWFRGADIGAMRMFEREFENITFDAATVKELGIPEEYVDQPMIRWIADCLGSDPGSGRVIGQAMEHAANQRVKMKMNRLGKMLAGYTEEERIAARDWLVGGGGGAVEPKGISERGAELGRKLRPWLNDQLAYMQEAGVPVKGHVNFFGRILDHRAIEENQQKFLDAATELYLAEGKNDPEAHAIAWLNNVLYPPSLRSRGLSGLFGGTPDHSASRTLSAKADELLRDFYIKDPLFALPQYAQRTSMLAEQTRRFGVKGERLDKVFQLLQKEMPPEDWGQLMAHVSSARGLLNVGNRNPTDKAVRGLMSWVQVWGTLKLLARTSVFQLTEPMNVGLRTHNLLNVPKAMVAQFDQYIGKSAGARESKQFAEVIGVAGEAAKQFIADAYAQGLPTEIPRRITTAFFDRTLVAPITEAQRVMTLRIWKPAFKAMLDDLVEGKGAVESARVVLGEYGVDKAKAKAVREWLAETDKLEGDAYYTRLGEDMSEPAKLYRAAMHDFALKAILEPTMAETPHLAKHPLMQGAYAITSFAYASVREIRNRAFKSVALALKPGVDIQSRMALLTPLAGYAIYAATMYWVNDMRAKVFSTKAHDNQTPLDKLRSGASAAGLFGTWDQVQNVLFPNGRYEKDPSTMFGADMPINAVQSLNTIWNARPSAPSNSANTNTNEYNAAREAYASIVAPVAAAGLSLLPLPGVIGAPAVMATTSRNASDAFAEAVAGPKGMPTDLDAEERAQWLEDERERNSPEAKREREEAKREEELEGI